MHSQAVSLPFRIRGTVHSTHTKIGAAHLRPTRPCSCPRFGGVGAQERRDRGWLTPTRGRVAARPIVLWGAVPDGSEGCAQGILTPSPGESSDPRPWVALYSSLSLTSPAHPQVGFDGSHCQMPPSRPPGASSLTRRCTSPSGPPLAEQTLSPRMPPPLHTASFFSLALMFPRHRPHKEGAPRGYAGCLPFCSGTSVLGAQ